MYSRVFDDHADAPAIIISPHQHQFDPISRAAHSYQHAPSKPVMDRRSYDVPLAASHAKKRSREEAISPPPMSPNVQAPAQFYSSSPIRLSPQSSQDFTSTHVCQAAPTSDYHGGSASDMVGVPVADNAGSSVFHRHKITRHNTASDIADQTSEINEPGSAQIFDDWKDSVTVGGVANADGQLSSSPTKALSRHMPIDEYTRALGISWRALPGISNSTADGNGDQEILVQSLRGLQRYLQNYFSHVLRDPVMIAQNKQQEYYLIQSENGWFLFDKDLAQGRLLAFEKQTALQNLAALPIRFQSEKIITPVSAVQINQSDESELLVGAMEMD